MHSIIADCANNVLMFIYQGYVGPDEGQTMVEKTAARIPLMRPGFMVLNDMTLLQRMSYDTCPFHRQIMDICNQNGVKKIARVIPDMGKDIGFNIMSAFHYDKSVEVQTFTDIETAWKFLTGG